MRHRNNRHALAVCGVLLLAGCSPAPEGSGARNSAEVMEMKADQMEETAEAQSNKAAMTMMEDAVPVTVNNADPGHADAQEKR